MYEINHEMMNYDFIEGTEFEGLMPKAIEKIGGIGASEESVALFPDATDVSATTVFRGHDALEVVDVEKLFDGGNSVEEGGEEGGEGNEGGEGGNTETPAESGSTETPAESGSTETPAESGSTVEP